MKTFTQIKKIATLWLYTDVNTNNKRSITQGGFKMKPVRFLTAMVVMILSTQMVFAITPAGTTITNVATGTYADVNGNDMGSVSSDPVTTTVSSVGGVTLQTDLTRL